MSTSGKDALIDLCRAWIENKRAAYILDINDVVWFESPTNRKTDYAWKHLTLDAVVRMIRISNQSMFEEQINKNHLVTAFQELGRIYEYGIHSIADVKPHIFNFAKEGRYDMLGVLCAEVASGLNNLGYKGVLLNDVKSLTMEVIQELELDYKFEEIYASMIKHLQDMHYDVRTGALRPLVKGKKENVALKHGYVPRNVVPLEEKDHLAIKSNCLGAFK